MLKCLLRCVHLHLARLQLHTHLMRLETDAVENENCVHRAKRSVVKLVLFHAYAKTFWSNRQRRLVGPLELPNLRLSLSSRGILQLLQIRLMQ